MLKTSTYHQLEEMYQQITLNLRGTYFVADGGTKIKKHETSIDFIQSKNLT